MARYKPNIGKIKTLEDANLALKEIGLLEHELETIDGEANKKIAEIKADCAKQGEVYRKRITDLSALFKDRKSQKLSFGEFGYRKSTAISVKKTTLELLKKLKLDRYIRVKEEIDKDLMAEMSDESLAQVDAVRKVKDAFFCQANREEVNKELLKEQVS